MRCRGYFAPNPSVSDSILIRLDWVLVNGERILKNLEAVANGLLGVGCQTYILTPNPAGSLTDELGFKTQGIAFSGQTHTNIHKRAQF